VAGLAERYIDIILEQTPTNLDKKYTAVARNPTKEGLFFPKPNKKPNQFKTKIAN
jgi:hypothetical protein